MDSIIIYIILFIVIVVLVLSIINYINTKRHIKECDYHNRLMIGHFKNLKFYLQKINALHDRMDCLTTVVQGIADSMKGAELTEKAKPDNDCIADNGVHIKTKEIVKVANCIPVSAEQSYTFEEDENKNRDVVYAELYSMLIEELRPYVKFGECEDFFHRVKTYTAEINIEKKINNTMW